MKNLCTDFKNFYTKINLLLILLTKSFLESPCIRKMKLKVIKHDVNVNHKSVSDLQWLKMEPKALLIDK